MRGVSPLMWRQILVRGDTTIADLQATFQLVLGWTDAPLHRFVIQGRAYGVAHLRGSSVPDDPHRVRLAARGLRVCERFLDENDFTDGGQHDVRVEQVEQLVPANPGRQHPKCLSGRRAVPPEDGGGPWAFLELRQPYAVVAVARQST